MHRTLFLFIVILARPAAPALGSELNGDKIQQLIGGKRIYLKTPLGGEFPMNYRSNGTVDADGKAKRKISDHGWGHPSYSPDGSLICTDLIAGKGRGGVYLIEPRTGKPKKLCNAPTIQEYKAVTGSCHQHPVWSRDGKSIIFDCNQSGTSQIYQVFLS